ncbi:alpha/beta fold hydrolase [Neobacillus dielmonensis]|uniref:alpha/beta fold hydrolase n=1 Tax=Neobacillus dielmonensis TaxID=1347369 RepID=UPI0005A79E65|nr:alpha/beta hydrolase [Neobacillus dielmonensis]
MGKKSVVVQDTAISYMDEGEGFPIVLLHGFCGSSGYWQEVVPVLTKNYRVIAPDLPGHGQSEVLRAPCTMEDLAAIILGFLDELHVQNVIMLGHSLGGYITLAFAEKYLDRLKGFSIVHSTAFPDSEEAKKNREANVQRINQNGIHSFVEGLVPNLFATENSNKPYVAAAKEIGYSTSPQGAMDTLIAMKNRPDRNSVLEATGLPVLLIAGENDRIVSPDKTFSVSKTNIKHALIKDAGHMSMYENPEELISIIKKFSDTVFSS